MSDHLDGTNHVIRNSHGGTDEDQTRRYRISNKKTSRHTWATYTSGDGPSDPVVLIFFIFCLLTAADMSSSSFIYLKTARQTFWKRCVFVLCVSPPVFHFGKFWNVHVQYKCPEARRSLKKSLKSCYHSPNPFKVKADTEAPLMSRELSKLSIP